MTRLLALLLVVGCSAQVSESTDANTIPPGPIACTTVTGSLSDDCAPGQTEVMRCTGAVTVPRGGCTGPAGAEDQSSGPVWCCAPDPNAIPSVCHNHTAKSFRAGTVACTPSKSPSCGFGVHNQPVPLNQSGEPLAYYCTCNSAGAYACFGSPSLAVAEPLE